MTALAALTGHYLRASFGNKFSLAFGALQPFLYLVLFGPLFARSGVGSWEVLVPGLLVQLGLTSAGMAGFGIVFDHRFGVLERLRVAPVSRVTLLLGRVLRDTVVLLIQAAAIIVVAWALGLRAPLAGAYTSSALLWGVVVSLAFAVVGVALGTRRFQRENA